MYWVKILDSIKVHKVELVNRHECDIYSQILVLINLPNFLYWFSGTCRSKNFLIGSPFQKQCCVRVWLVLKSYLTKLRHMLHLNDIMIYIPDSNFVDRTLSVHMKETWLLPGHFATMFVNLRSASYTRWIYLVLKLLFFVPLCRNMYM